MNRLNGIFFLLVLLLCFACENPAPQGNGETPSPSDYDPNPSTSTDTNASNPGETDKTNDSNSTASFPEQKDCSVADQHFDKNVFLMKELAQQVCIVATDATKDKDLGDSHRVLRVVNTKDCSTILEKTLPINRSADFPYYLVPQTYEPKNQILAIQGFSSTYYCDIKNQTLVGPIVPQFLSDREAVDAQSGMMKGLTIWEHYLLGRSVDFGNFAFDISDVSNPKPVLPVAEYLIPKTAEYNNLFVLEADNGRYQALIPTTDIDAGGSLFEVAPLFLQSLDIDPTVAKNVRDNRFIVFNNKSNQKVVVDMFSKKRIDLPAAIASQKTGEVLNWLKSNTQ